MDEELRLQVVKQFERLNFKYNQQLQQLVSFAAKVFQTPIATITLIDKAKRLIQVNKGNDMDNTDREHSFCSLVVKHKRLLIINDTLLDPRFCTNPTVAGSPGIRFYAGYPLITLDGHCIGTLCVMDKKNRETTVQQQIVLKVLAQNAVNAMELKLSQDLLSKSTSLLKEAKKEKSTSETKLRAMFESLPDAYFLLGKNGEIIDFNQGAYHYIKEDFHIKLSRGRIMSGFLNTEYRSVFALYYDKALNGEKTQIERLANYGADGTTWLDCRFEPVKNEDGEIIGVSYLIRNINQRKLISLKVMEQNAVLHRIAEIQSHEYRAPVASILGIMALIKADNYSASRDCLLMLQSAASALDQKIHEVVSIVNVNDRLS